MVSEDTVTKFCHQQVSFVVLYGCNGGGLRFIGSSIECIAIIVGKEEPILWAIVHRLDKLGSDKRTSRNDPFQGDHSTQLCRTECTWADMVVAKGTTETDMISLLFKVLFVFILGPGYDFHEGSFEGWAVVHRLV